MMARNVVEYGSILVNILKYTQASFSSFSVIWLGSSTSRKDVKIDVYLFCIKIFKFITIMIQWILLRIRWLTLQFLTSSGCHGCFGNGHYPSWHVHLCGQHFLQSRNRFGYDLQQGVQWNVEPWHHCPSWQVSFPCCCNIVEHRFQWIVRKLLLVHFAMRWQNFVHQRNGLEQKLGNLHVGLMDVGWNFVADVVLDDLVDVRKMVWRIRQIVLGRKGLCNKQQVKSWSSTSEISKNKIHNKFNNSAWSKINKVAILYKYIKYSFIFEQT